MSAAGPLMSGLGTGIEIVGAIREGNAQAAAAEYNAQNSEQNATLSRQKAAEEERRSRAMGRKTIGEMRASYGASGVSSAEGSALDVLEQSAATAELDALTIRHGGETTARAYEASARLDRFNAKNAKVKGYMTAASKFLAGASKLGGSIGGGGGAS